MPDLIKIRSAWGDVHYVRRSDFDNPRRDLLALYKGGGKRIDDMRGHKPGDGWCIARANIAEVLP